LTGQEPDLGETIERLQAQVAAARARLEIERARLEARELGEELAPRSVVVPLRRER
jgi:hypothetical protein